MGDLDGLILDVATVVIVFRGCIRKVSGSNDDDDDECWIRFGFNCINVLIYVSVVDAILLSS